jgi:dephospho-CoA kinase
LKIALLGKMRSGKDTIGEYAASKYGFVRYAFGDELKRYYHELFGKTESKPREGYQWFGQICRSHDPDIWVRKCFENIHEQNVIITDLRQPNEYERCLNEGFTFIKVHCDDDIRIKRILEKNDRFNTKDLQHETESYIDTYEYDYLIENNSTLDELLKKFDEIFTDIK